MEPKRTGYRSATGIRICNTGGGEMIVVEGLSRIWRNGFDGLKGLKDELRNKKIWKSRGGYGRE